MSPQTIHRVGLHSIPPAALPTMIQFLLLTLLIHFLPFARATSWSYMSDYPLPLLTQSNHTLAYAELDRGPPWTPEQPCPQVINVHNHHYNHCFEHPKAYGCRFHTWNTIHSALTRCPDVEELLLHLDGCDVRSSLHVEPRFTVSNFSRSYSVPLTVGDPCNLPFHPSGKDRYPSLRTLRVSGYKFGGPWLVKAEEGPRQEESEFVKEEGLGMERWEEYIRNVEQVEHFARRPRNETTEKSEETNLHRWLKAMDWGQLEELSINWGKNPEVDVVKELPVRLKSLKSLEITNVDFIEGLRNNTLTSLKWVGRTRPGELNRILAHQGQSLQALDYRCEEVDCLTFPNHFNLQELPALAPQLERLSINMPRDGSWPWEDLKALSSMQKLQTVELYFRMQSSCSIRDALFKATPGADLNPYFYGAQSELRKRCQGTDRYETPYLNYTTAAEMFSHMRNNKQGSELQNVAFLTGDWSSSGSAAYIANRRSRVRCSVTDGREVCRAENEKYGQYRYGLEHEYLDEGGTWYGDEWRNYEELERVWTQHQLATEEEEI